MKLVWTLLTLLLVATLASAAWAQNPIPVTIVSGGSLTASTAATASAAPTAVVAGTGKPINESLFSELWTSLSVGGVPVTLGVANANSTAPLAVQVMVSDNTNLQRVFAPLQLADGVNGNNMVAGGNYVWNGTSWDRQRGRVCQSHVTKTIAAATDTQIVAANGSMNIYVCDYELSFNAANNLYLEKATTGTCATLTQISMTWYGAANTGKAAGNPYYRGLNTGASAQLCAKTTTTAATDITVYYDQY